MSEPSRSVAEWTGRSGRTYRLEARAPESVHVRDDAICLLSVMSDAGETAIWAGTAQSLIDDPASRDLFRAALPRAASAWVMAAPRDIVDRETLLWDLENSRRADSRHAA